MNLRISEFSDRCYLFYFSSCKGTKWSCTDHVCPGTCSVYGELNYITFDDRRYTFSGACDYVLAQDSCNDASSRTFQIQAQNVPCGNSGVTCTKQVTITLNNTVVTLERDQHPVISSRPGAAALSMIEEFQIREHHFFTVLETGFGLTITWDRGTRLYITLDPKFTGEWKFYWCLLWHERIKFIIIWRGSPELKSRRSYWFFLGLNFAIQTVST